MGIIDEPLSPGNDDKLDTELGQWSVFNEASLRKGLYFMPLLELLSKKCST